MIWNIEIRNAYNFTTYATPILGTGFTAAMVMTSMMDFEAAVKHNQNLVVLHRQVITSLPSGTPTQARDLTYMLLKTSSGETVVLAHEWVSSQPELMTSQTIRVDVAETSGFDLQKIRDVLIAAGYTKIKMGFI
jgi:hypothetical protein